MNILRTAALAASLLAAGTASAVDVVKLGNLKFAHYGAVSYMKEHCGKFGLQVEEIVFPKGIDIFPAIVRGEVDLAASAADAAVANRAAGGPVLVVAGFAKGGARLVVRNDLAASKVTDLKGKKVGVARGGAQELLLLGHDREGGQAARGQEGERVHRALPTGRRALLAGGAGRRRALIPRWPRPPSKAG